MHYKISTRKTRKTRKTRRTRKTRNRRKASQRRQRRYKGGVIPPSAIVSIQQDPMSARMLVGAEEAEDLFDKLEHTV